MVVCMMLNKVKNGEYVCLTLCAAINGELLFILCGVAKFSFRTGSIVFPRT